METNQSRPQPFDTLLKATAYLLGGIFLYTAKVTGTTALVAQVFGVVFVAFAFFLVIAPFFDRLGDWAHRANLWLLLGLFSATLARVVIAGVESPKFLYVVVAFLVLTGGVSLFYIYRSIRERALNLGNKGVAESLRVFMNTVGISRCMSRTKRFVRSMIQGLVIGLLAFVIAFMYMGVILLIANPGKYGGDYVPFALAGVIAAIAGLVLTIAHIDKDLKEAKQDLVNTGELYAFAALALVAFGLFFPVYDGLKQPFDAYCIPFLFVVLTLVAFCVLSGMATYRFIRVLWKKRKDFFKDTLEK